MLPQFNYTTYMGDIAVLELSSPVEFTPYVRPVCLWDSNETELSEIVGKEGTVSKFLCTVFTLEIYKFMKFILSATTNTGIKLY